MILSVSSRPRLPPGLGADPDGDSGRSLSLLLVAGTLQSRGEQRPDAMIERMAASCVSNRLEAFYLFAFQK